MNGPSHSTLLGMAATAVAISFCLTAWAANPCQPVFDAQDKLTMTPRHTYSTIIAVFTHGQPHVSETIVANGKIYIRVNAKWRRDLTSLQVIEEQQKKTASTPRLHANSRATKWSALKPRVSIPCTLKVKMIQKTDRSGSRRQPDCRCATSRTSMLAVEQVRNTDRRDLNMETSNHRCEHQVQT
jgi:hypothetical protein